MIVFFFSVNSIWISGVWVVPVDMREVGSRGVGWAVFWGSAVGGPPYWVFVRFHSELGVSIRIRGAPFWILRCPFGIAGIRGWLSICAFFLFGPSLLGGARFR